MTNATNTTIGDLIAQVPEGGEQLFEKRKPPVGDNRYFAVRQNADYFPWPEWHNSLPLEDLPWPGSRQKKRIPISVLPDMDLTFSGNSEELVDFYQTGCQAFLVSDKLVSIIESLDENSIDRRSVIIKSKDKNTTFNLVMSRRNIEAIDLNTTSIIVKDKDYGKRQFIREVIFPDGVNFDQEKVGNAVTFTELDTPGWFWSRDLIESAKREGIKGFYTTVPGIVTSVAVDSL